MASLTAPTTRRGAIAAVAGAALALTGTFAPNGADAQTRANLVRSNQVVTTTAVTSVVVCEAGASRHFALRTEGPQFNTRVLHKNGFVSFSFDYHPYDRSKEWLTPDDLQYGTSLEDFRQPSVGAPIELGQYVTHAPERRALLTSGGAELARLVREHAALICQEASGQRTLAPDHPSVRALSDAMQTLARRLGPRDRPNRVSSLN